ncbi:Uncharacterized protein OS=Ktedonobacter racemifer DSM 44963 GN=Krac_0815 PE=4 SV=1 [Gemmata massiliana]|uniref:Uncharacterized protein n=1 Tax=Gemmata massiliana TaxID=1210884 RepID=A0A6P2CV61_9BACT|nr:hypothetical protein [Gemmata massiliana]VTR91060.1 Uncharacterized protein OS=Ktedonobacter racemifer DSM 44963 GN=Krac_0815 PE=4 SV=1 [Gemmata massiliana]
MSANLSDYRAGVPPVALPDTGDPAFAARPRLLVLREALIRAAKQLRPARWNEPAVFFFDAKRQAELEAVRSAEPDRFAELTALIAAELPALLAHVEVRRLARALDGLKAAALAMAPHAAAANDLADLLTVPDDEVFLVVAPNERTGVRLHVRGAAGIAQLHRLLAETGLTYPSTPSLKGRGEKLGFQMFKPAALLPDGTLPVGLAGCEHWLWPTQALAAIPRVAGERVVLVGPATVRPALDVEPRFPEMSVESEVIQTLNPFQVTDVLSRLSGHPVPVTAPANATAVARAA